MLPRTQLLHQIKNSKNEQGNPPFLNKRILGVMKVLGILIHYDTACSNSTEPQEEKAQGEAHRQGSSVSLHCGDSD